jgi:NAD(P)H-hydrate epimerase
MREVDRLTIEDYGIALLQMMENAGRGLATLAHHHLANSVAGRHIVILIGPGNNGGGGLVAARHLVNAGASVTVALSREPPLPSAVPEQQRSILARMGVAGCGHEMLPHDLVTVLGQAELILDALLGYSGRGAPREPIASFIRAANSARAPRLALDLPSGLEGDSGLGATPTLEATATLTLAWPKRGLLAPGARRFIGDLYLTDISIPDAVYRAVGVERGNLFSAGPLVHLRTTREVWAPDAAS